MTDTETSSLVRPSPCHDHALILRQRGNFIFFPLFLFVLLSDFHLHLLATAEVRVDTTRVQHMQSRHPKENHGVELDIRPEIVEMVDLMGDVRGNTEVFFVKFCVLGFD
jgi:hypothetical protein